jgi:LuxR family transcriptional regulator, maltose regulon positive regulatory protein
VDVHLGELRAERVVLDRLSGALCAALVGETDQTLSAGDGQALLEQLEAASLFLGPLDHSRTW